jgi:UDP-glucuronate 4-epimerase
VERKIALHGGSVLKRRDIEHRQQERQTMRVLITGAAGFIGSTLALRLLERGDAVYGIDNLNDYYDVSLKEARLKRCQANRRFTFEKLDIIDRPTMERLFSANRFDAVMHLAAQAGVRYSIENPAAYVDANLVGFGNILEGCRHSKVGHLVFASSSSVYGANTKLPFSEHDNVDHPVSLYAASKKANELMAHCYAHLYRLPCTGLRFFTVYGPWGRPDMALFKFTKGILDGKPIPVFNQGKMVRDFTYIDDIVEGVVRVIDRPAKPDPTWSGDDPDCATSYAPYRVYNIGNNQPVELMRYIEVLEQSLGKKAVLDLLPMQPGDVPATYANVDALARDAGFRPATSVETGIGRFVEWYRSYYGVR